MSSFAQLLPGTIVSITAGGVANVNTECDLIDGDGSVVTVAADERCVIDSLMISASAANNEGPDHADVYGGDPANAPIILSMWYPRTPATGLSGTGHISMNCGPWGFPCDLGEPPVMRSSTAQVFVCGFGRVAKASDLTAARTALSQLALILQSAAG